MILTTSPIIDFDPENPGKPKGYQYGTPEIEFYDITGITERED